MPQIWFVSVENAQKSIQDHLPPLNIHKLTILPPKPKFRDKPTSHMVSWTAWVEVLLGVVRDQRNKNQINNGWVSRNSTKKQSTQSRRSNFCLCGEISGTRTAAGLVDYHKYGQCTNHARWANGAFMAVCAFLPAENYAANFGPNGYALSPFLGHKTQSYPRESKRLRGNWS